MTKKEVAGCLMELITGKLQGFGISSSEVDDNFELVKSGLLDSMSFIDIVASLEERFDVQIDFEKVAEQDTFTTFGGLIQLIIDTKNAR